MMNRILIALLVTCALTAAMVPRHRRAIDMDENHGDTTAKGRELCAPTTPCGWEIYDPKTKQVYQDATNPYCDCRPGELCLRGPDDDTAYAYVYLCKPDNTNPVNTSKS